MRNNSYFIDVGAVSAVVDVQQRLIFYFLGGQKSVAAMAATAATLPTPLKLHKDCPAGMCLASHIYITTPQSVGFQSISSRLSICSINSLKKAPALFTSSSSFRFRTRYMCTLHSCVTCALVHGLLFSIRTVKKKPDSGP